MVLDAAAVEGMQGPLACFKEVGWGIVDAFGGVEDDAQVAVVIGHCDGSAAKQPGRYAQAAKQPGMQRYA